MNTLRSSVGRHGPAWRPIALLVALILASVGLIAVPAFGEDGPHPDISNLPSEGVLRLHLDDVGGAPEDYFLYEEWDGTDSYDPTATASFAAPPSIQQIGPDIRCELIRSAAVNGPLANLSSVDGGNVGIFDDLIGIRFGGSRATDCSRVNVGEGALSLSLVDDLADLEIDYAEIDVEAKQNVVISMQPWLGGARLGNPMEALNCMAQDCGADSGGTDNFRIIVAVAGSTPANLASSDPTNPAAADVVIPSPADRLDFFVTSASGEFSLGGGQDNTPRAPLGDFLHTDDSLFHLTDIQSLECGVPAELGDEELGGTYTLQGCLGFKTITFVADRDENEVIITNVGDGPEGAYSVESWTFLPAPVGSQLFYDDGFSDGTTTEFPALFCLDDPRVDPDWPGDLTPEDYLPPNPGTDQEDGLHTTCIIEEMRTTSGQMDFGEGPETSIIAEFLLLSIGDAGRSFR